MNCVGGKHLQPVHLNRGRKAHIWICLACGRDSKGGSVEPKYLEEIKTMVNGAKTKAESPKPPEAASAPSVSSIGEMRRCKGCGVPIRFVRGENGKVVPLDVRAPVYEIVSDLTGAEVAKRVAGAKTFVSHWSTCPKWGDIKKGAQP